jgi:hypothetical protein
LMTRRRTRSRPWPPSCRRQNVAMPEGPGDYIVVPVTREHVADGSIRQLLSALSANGKAEVLAQSLAAVQGDPTRFRHWCRVRLLIPRRPCGPRLHSGSQLPPDTANA